MLSCVSASLLAGGSCAFTSLVAIHVYSCCPLTLQKSEGRACRAPTSLTSAAQLAGGFMQMLATAVSFWCLFGGETQQNLLVFGLSLLLTLFTLIVDSWVLTVITPSNCLSVSGLSVCFMNTYVPSKQVKLILLRE